MVNLGSFTFYLYGALIGLGILLGVEVAERVRKKLSEENKSWRGFSVWDSLLWVIGGGIVGARIYHVIDLWGYYSQNMVEIMMINMGGMGIFGGIAGGLVGGIRPLKLAKMMKSKEYSLFTAIEKSGYLKLLDLGGLGLPLGQAVGRWGNYFNQELYGLPTKLPWGIYIRPENRLLAVMGEERFHPLFLYESLWNFGVFGVLYWLYRTGKVKMGKGRLFVYYLGLYGLGRFWLEFLRIESWSVNGINVAQAISLGLIAGAVWFIKKKS